MVVGGGDGKAFGASSFSAGANVGLPPPVGAPVPYLTWSIGLADLDLPTPMETEFVKFIAQAAISVSGAFLAAGLASRRFRTEKWWERKANAYTDLVSALHEMKWPSSEGLDAEIEGARHSPEEVEKLWAQFRLARRNVWRIADASAFLVSPRVLRSVQQMENALAKAENSKGSYEHLEAQYKAVQTCLDEIKTLGRGELGIKAA